MSIEDRLKELNIELPDVPGPGGNYVPAVQTGNLLYLSGKGSGPSTGKVGTDVDIDTAYQDARRVGLVLVGPESPLVTPSHRVKRNASQKPNLATGGIVHSLHALDQRLQGRRISLVLDFQVCPTDRPQVYGVLVPVDCRAHLTQSVAKFRLALSLHRHLREREHC